MPTLVRELDQGLAYTFCPTCRLAGNPKSPLARDMHQLKCALGHSFTGAQLQAMYADMVPMASIQPEVPSITDVKWSIWINPKVKEKLEQKFPNRIIFTVATLLAALADDSLVMITGEQGEKLRKEYQVKSGAEIIAKFESLKQCEEERDSAVKELDKFQKMMQAVMAGAGGGQ
jgi:hypothetical protein